MSSDVSIVSTSPSVCEKVRYTSERFALMDIKRIKKISTRDKIPVRAYFCDLCGFWHLTSAKSKNDEVKDKKILELELTITTLKDEVRALKIALNEQKNQNNKEDRLLLKKDQVVTDMIRSVDSLNKQIKKIRLESNDLITKNLQLERKLEQYEK
jgi:hypothetical protein